jgi:small subunit ribosomal protein S35
MRRQLTYVLELAKPFVPPSKDQPLQFRYTTYLGEEHPAEKKVVLQFCTKDMLDLTEVQRDKLIKLVGVRYNPETDVVKMSCEMFETQAQNKRYLGDLVETLLREAKVYTPCIIPDPCSNLPLVEANAHICR